jgi:hypothetical protein
MQNLGWKAFEYLISVHLTLPRQCRSNLNLKEITFEMFLMIVYVVCVLRIKIVLLFRLYYI